MLEQVQQFGDSEFYSITLDNEPEKTRNWFRATELCKTLNHSDPYRAVTQYCKEWQYREFQAGKGRPALYVCESGVYRLILRSKSPEAIEFQDWLTEEVLPKLRANGSYSVAPVSTSSLALPSTELASIHREIELLKKESRAQRRHFITRLDWLCGMAEVKEMPDRVRVGFHASVPLAGYLTDLGFEVLSGEELKDTFAKKHHWFDDSPSIRIAVNEYYN